MNIVIIGCGLIGRKRALALDDKDKLIACCDTNSEAAEAFGREFSCKTFSDYKKMFSETEFEAVVVAVVNKYIKEITIDVLKLEKNVIAEKPLGRNAGESRNIINALEEWKKGGMRNSNIPVLKTGFNHRFHPAVWQAKKMLDVPDRPHLFPPTSISVSGAMPSSQKYAPKRMRCVADG